MSELQWLLYSYVAACGLLVGSFLNVCALRLGQGQSVVHPPSNCPNCRTRLRPYELIPVLSYLIQRGRCRHCGAGISALYPVGEVLTAGLFLLMYAVHGLSLELVAGLLISSALVVAVVADWSFGIIPFRFIIPCLVLMMALRAFTEGADVWKTALAIAVTWGMFYLIEIIYRSVRKKSELPAFGGGDVMLFLLLAAALGLPLTLLCLFLASLFGVALYLLGAVVAAVRRNEDGPGTLRFAPAILPAAIISYLWGESLLQLYFAQIVHI